MLSQYKQYVTPLIAIIAKPFLSWNPSVLTFFSLVSAILFFAGLISHLYVISLISIAGFIFDMLDGYVARTTKTTSLFGAFLDATLDRASDFFIIASFGFAHLVRWELVIAVVCSTFLISYIHAKGESLFTQARPISRGLMQRTERIIFVLLSFFIFLIFPHMTIASYSVLSVSFFLLLILNCYTIFQGLTYFAKLSTQS